MRRAPVGPLRGHRPGAPSASFRERTDERITKRLAQTWSWADAEPHEDRHHPKVAHPRSRHPEVAHVSPACEDLDMTKLIEQDIGFADIAPWTLDFEGIVVATPAEVWGAFVDNESWTKWFKNCRRCHATSATFDGVGATRAISVNGLRVDERFIAWEPEHLWAFTASSMRMSFTNSLVERVRFSDLGDGTTKIDYRMALAPKRWAGPLRKLIAGQANKAFAQSFRDLDTYLAATRRSAPA